jgi:hypothetical protein
MRLSPAMAASVACPARDAAVVEPAVARRPGRTLAPLGRDKRVELSLDQLVVAADQPDELLLERRG